MTRRHAINVAVALAIAALLLHVAVRTAGIVDATAEQMEWAAG